MKATNYLNKIAVQLHPYMASVFLTGNGIFQKDNAPCHKAQMVLEWFQEHNDEFQLMSWPPNSTDINLIEHILALIERQLKDQTPTCLNISTLHNSCFDIWYSLSPMIYQEFVASMIRQVSAILLAKGDAMLFWVGGHNVLAHQCMPLNHIDMNTVKYKCLEI